MPKTYTGDTGDEEVKCIANTPRNIYSHACTGTRHSHNHSHNQVPKYMELIKTFSPDMLVACSSGSTIIVRLVK